jgi:hypothetical protein
MAFLVKVVGIGLGRILIRLAVFSKCSKAAIPVALEKQSQIAQVN